VCDLETSWMRRPWPTGGLLRQKKNYCGQPVMKLWYSSTSYWARSHSCEKKTIIFVSSVYPSVCPQISARLPLDGFPWNLILGTSMKIWREPPNLFKIGQKYWALNTNTYVSVRLIVAGDINLPYKHFYATLSVFMLLTVTCTYRKHFCDFHWKKGYAHTP